MRRQGFWVAVVGPETFETERLYANETIAVDQIATDRAQVDPGFVDAELVSPQPGDQVALVAALDDRLLFGLGQVTTSSGHPRIRYTHRLFDEPQPAAVAGVPGSLFAVAEADFAHLTAGIGAQHRVDRDRTEWFVSVALPIEASSRAEAVREFWSYVDKLGARELPAFVWPRGDELAMQAFLLGAETNLDPESDDD